MGQFYEGGGIAFMDQNGNVDKFFHGAAEEWKCNIFSSPYFWRVKHLFCCSLQTIRDLDELYELNSASWEEVFDTLTLVKFSRRTLTKFKLEHYC